MARIFGDNPIMEPEDPSLAESNVTKVGVSIDILATYIWPKLLATSQDKLLLVCKKWGKEVTNAFNFPRPQTLNWVYAKRLVLTCTQTSVKVVRIEPHQDEAEGRTIHSKCLCQVWGLWASGGFFPWMYLALLNRRYIWDNSYHMMIFKGRFNYVPGDGY